MAGHLLGHYWNNGYNTFLENHSDVCNFAKLVDLHFRQRMKLKFDMNLLLFWSTFWLMDKVTKLSPRTFSICFQNYRSERSCDREFQIVTNWMLQQQWKPSQIPSSTFRQAFLKFSTSTTIIKTWTSASSSSKQIQIEFTPLILASEPISVSNDSFALSMLPEEILLKIGEFAGVEAMRNLIATCKYIRNQLNTWFLQALASENNPDRATSGFIVDAIGNKGNTCLWRNAKFFIKDHDVPKDLSIHLFANTTAEKISSDEVRSMIIQVIRITEVVWRYSQIPNISFPQSVIQESEMFNVLWDRTFEGILPRDRSIEFGCISHEKFPLSHRF